MLGKTGVNHSWERESVTIASVILMFVIEMFVIEMSVTVTG